MRDATGGHANFLKASGHLLAQQKPRIEINLETHRLGYLLSPSLDSLQVIGYIHVHTYIYEPVNTETLKRPYTLICAPTPKLSFTFNKNCERRLVKVEHVKQKMSFRHDSGHCGSTIATAFIPPRSPLCPFKS
jgi:hypothetical protein